MLYLYSKIVGKLRIAGETLVLLIKVFWSKEYIFMCYFSVAIISRFGKLVFSAPISVPQHTF